MSDQPLSTDLFALGQQHFKAFIAEFASYGLEADPGLELRRGSGLLCYYSLDDRQIYLAVPDFSQPVGKLQALFLRSLLGCQDNTELIHFFELFIPHIIAHELAHHYRHRYGLFSGNLWDEEQIANKLAVAVVKHRLSPEQRAQAKKFLQQAIETLAAKMEAKNIAIDSYYSVLHALNVSGQIGVTDFENIELLQQAVGVTSDDLLKGSGQLSDDLLARLEQRGHLIEEINHEYTSDQIKYIYYHVGWLHLDLTSRETEYVDDFARTYLNLRIDLLPEIHVPSSATATAVQACFKAYQDTQPHSAVASRFFYKRYRSLLMAMLQTTELAGATHGEQLKREASLVLESWSEGEHDTLIYLAQLAPPSLRALFPHTIASQLESQLDVAAHLPTATDRRMWSYVLGHAADPAVTNTLHRLELLDQTDIYRALPAELMLQLTHRLSQVHFAPGETVIWEGEHNDDVYFLLTGRLEVLVTMHDQPVKVGELHPGEMFGEIAFFTEDPRLATVRAAEVSQCFVLTDTALQLLAFKHPTILMKMASALAKRLAELYQTSRNETI